MLLERTIQEHICFLCHWELTHACNLRCRHCYLDPAHRATGCTFEEARRVLDQLREMGCLFLVFTGGEILLHPDFFAIAAYARRNSFALRLMTNGTLIDRATAARIADLDPVSVEMSLYASTAALHDRITGVPGSFAATMAAAGHLRRHALRVVFKSLIMRENRDELPAMQACARRMGAEYLFDMTMVRRNDGSAAPLALKLTPDEMRQFFRDNPLSVRPVPEEAGLACTAGMNTLFIDACLEVFPCIGLKLSLGKARDDCLRELWQEAPALKKLRGLKEEDFRECLQCPTRNLCMRCLGNAQEASGSLTGKSPSDCEVAQAFAQTIKRSA